MIELPELVVWLIAEHLSYEDLQNLLVTCKKLNVIINQRTFRSLHLFVNGYPRKKELHTGELVSYANTFYAPKLDIFKSIRFKCQFTGLHKLTVHYGRQPRWREKTRVVDLDDLNCLVELVHLEINGPALGAGRLNLKNLEIACFYTLHTNTQAFELNCPRLKALSLAYTNEPRLTAETSRSIRHLVLRYSWAGSKHLLHSNAGLPNLSTICFNIEAVHPSQICEDVNSLVLALIERRLCIPSLKRIELKAIGCVSEQMLRNLATLKSNQQTKHIELQIHRKVIALDELVELLELLPELISMEPSLNELYFAIPELNLLQAFVEKPALDCLLRGVYDLRLQSNEHLTLARQLIGKLTNLFRLSILEGLELDADLFEGILKACSKRLYDLYIGSALLKQAQLERMSDCFASLEVLHMREFGLGNFNLEFVAKFKNLFFFDINYNLPSEMMRFLLKNCKYQPDFRAEIYGEQKIWIFPQRLEMITADKSVVIYQEVPNKKAKFDNVDELVEYYYRNDLFHTPWTPCETPIEQPTIVSDDGFRCSLI